MSYGISPPTAAVNLAIQCGTLGCATMLLDDGTCPRCNPPSRRPTDEKLRLSEYYQDERLQRLAHAEIEAGIATGIAPRRRVREVRRFDPELPSEIDTPERSPDVDDPERT